MHPGTKEMHLGSRSDRWLKFVIREVGLEWKFNLRVFVAVLNSSHFELEGLVK